MPGAVTEDDDVWPNSGKFSLKLLYSSSLGFCDVRLLTRSALCSLLVDAERAVLAKSLDFQEAKVWLRFFAPLELVPSFLPLLLAQTTCGAQRVDARLALTYLCRNIAALPGPGR